MRQLSDVVWHDRRAVISFRTVCSICEEFSDFDVQRLVEVSGRLVVVEVLLDATLDDEFRHETTRLAFEYNAVVVQPLVLMESESKVRI